MRISDWSSDVCSSDLRRELAHEVQAANATISLRPDRHPARRSKPRRAAPTGWKQYPRAWCAASATSRIHDIKVSRRDGRRRSRVKNHEKKIGRAHVCTPVTNAHLVCRLLLEKKNKTTNKKKTKNRE